MKTKIIILFSIVTITSQSLWGQSEISTKDLGIRSKEVLKSMIKESPSLQFYFENSFGYAVFPKVTKLGLTLGGAAGKGLVYKNNKVVSGTKLKQITWGSQLGCQQYSEVIFFLDEQSFNAFMNKKIKFNGQASAVALKSGASADVPYSYDVAVFTQSIGGLMVEASIGFQCFVNKEVSN